MLMGGPIVRAQKSTTALQMEKLGYVDVLDVDSALRVSLMYARADNFMGRVLYKDLRCIPRQQNLSPVPVKFCKRNTRI